MELLLTILVALNSQPWQPIGTWRCDIYPAPNGGFVEQCYWEYPDIPPTQTCPSMIVECAAN